MSTYAIFYMAIHHKFLDESKNRLTEKPEESISSLQMLQGFDGLRRRVYMRLNVSGQHFQ